MISKRKRSLSLQFVKNISLIWIGTPYPKVYVFKRREILIVSGFKRIQMRSEDLRNRVSYNSVSRKLSHAICRQKLDINSFWFKTPSNFQPHSTRHAVVLYLWRPTTTFYTLHSLQRIAETKEKEGLYNTADWGPQSTFVVFHIECQLPTFYCKPRP